MTRVTLTGVRKVFGDFVALQGLDLDMLDGEFVSFLGPSGCGKTTALRIIAGFEVADAGTVQIDGDVVDGMPPSKRDMGIVFQSYSLFPNMTAEENVAFGLRVRRRPEADIRSRVAAMLDLVGLAGKERNYPHQMSGGQQQRVALARALAIEPRVLLLDEPLSALDAKVRVSLRNEIREIQQALRISTIFVTHDQEEALSISDRIAVFSAGRLEQFGSPEDIYLRPASEFVARFVGESNMLPGEVVSADPARVRIGQTEMNIAGPLPFPAGTQVLIRSRPEHTLVRPADQDGLPGTVLSRQFQGATSRTSIRLDGDLMPLGIIICDLPAEQATDFPSGTSVRINVDPERALALAADTTTS